MSNLGYLRMAVEDALVAYLKTSIGADLATVRPAFTTETIEENVVTVFARETQEVNEVSTGARYVMVEIRCATYAVNRDLMTAREAHYALVAQAYDALRGASPDVLNALGVPRVVFWQVEHPLTETGGVTDASYLTTIQLQAGASPKEL